MIVASLIIEHTVNFALSGNSHGPCNMICVQIIYLDIRICYEISVFEVLRGDCNMMLDQLLSIGMRILFLIITNIFLITEGTFR